MHPLAFDPHVKMGKLLRLAQQDAGITGRAEAIQRLGRDLPGFASNEDVLGHPARERWHPVGWIAVEMDVDMRPFIGADLNGDLRSGAYGAASDQLQIDEHGACSS